MSYTAIRGFSLGSRPPLPLGGGNVAALQHEGRVGLGDQEGPFGPKEGAAEHLWAAAARPRGPRERWAEARGRRGGLDGQRDSLHRPCSAEAAREVARGPRPGTSRGSGGWGPGREERAVAASGLPGTWRASPRPGRGSGSAGRCGPSQARPRGGSGGLGPQEVGLWTPGLPAAAQNPGCLLSGSPPRGSHLRDDSRSSRRTRRWGREAGPEVEREAWRPRAESAAASTARGRWDTLRLCPTRQETFRSGGENIKTNGRQAPVPARLSPDPHQPVPAPVPATGHHLGRPLQGRAVGIWSPDATTNPVSLAAAATSAYLASSGRHSDSD